MGNLTCSEEQCDRAARPSGLCNRHDRIKWALLYDRHCRIEGCGDRDILGDLCGHHYQQHRPRPQCEHAGCKELSQNTKTRYCAKHYARLRRHGATDRSTWGLQGLSPVGGKYRVTQRPGHPVASPSGNIQVHRMILFDAIGLGPHPCHWCGAKLTWQRQPDCKPLQVDHLNGHRDDNRLENLAASCQRCNVTRGQQERAHRRRDLGWWSRNDTIAETRAAPLPIPSEFA